MSDLDSLPDRQATPLPPDMNARELARWTWRQITSMRTALVLLLLLALAAIPGSVIPQEDVDSLAAGRWRDAHPTLTPIYEKLGMFSVYDSVWFSAIYILLMLSLVGCILPRTAVYWRALRSRPPAAPRRLNRLPEYTSTATARPSDAVLSEAAVLLRRRRYRVETGEGWVAGEKGYLREAGNLLFHLAVLVVLVGFAMGSLFGFKAGLIVNVGGGFSNNATQYDEFVPGSLFGPDDLDGFSVDVDDFDITWLTEGAAKGQARKFVSHVSYETADGETGEYDLRVNHPLAIGDTEVFLIGHGYSPVITIRDGQGEVTYTGPTPFLPTDQTFESFGVIKAPYAEPEQIALEGTFYPTFALGDGFPRSVFGDAVNPLISLFVYTGNVGLDSGRSQSVYVLDKSRLTQIMKDNPDGAPEQPLRLDLRPGDKVDLPDGLGSVEFTGLQRWNKLQVSETPGRFIALGGVVLALIGLLGSLFIRPRRVWVRVRRLGGVEGAEGTLLELGALDRSSSGDPERGAEELASIMEQLNTPPSGQSEQSEGTRT